MSEKTKDELSQELNETLGMNVDWSRLTKDELIEFKSLVDSGKILEQVTENMVKEKGKQKAEETIDSWEPGAVLKRII